jgi:hypothetical protein
MIRKQMSMTRPNTIFNLTPQCPSDYLLTLSRSIPFVMAITLQEMKILREVLLTITNITLTTRQTLLDLSKSQLTAADRDHIKKEIRNLNTSITATHSLLLFYESRIQEEIEKGEVRRHMEDAKGLCGAIREIRREQREQVSQREQLALKEQLVGIREENTPEEMEMERIARYKAGYMSKEQVFEVARVIKECEEAKALRLLEEKNEGKESLEDDEMTLVGDESTSQQRVVSSTALLQRISISLHKITKTSKPGSLYRDSREDGLNVELGGAESSSKGPLTRMMRSMSLRSRRTSDLP